jgi:CheY-like chemotaxis protein
MKVLIVDDSLLDRKLLSKTLVNLGVKNEIVLADSADAAMQLIVENMDQLCLMFFDYQMPNMSGLELMQGLMSVPQTASIPIVMCTASASEESKSAAYSVNPKLAGYITKPYKPEEVRAVIKPYVQF